MGPLAPLYRDLVDLNGTASRKRGWIVLGGAVVVLALCQLAVELRLAPEKLPDGRRSAVLNIGTVSAADDAGIFLARPETLFLLGDNRDTSNDPRFSISARAMGFVPVENVRYRADWVILSEGTTSVSAILRPGRFLMGVE